MPSTSAKQHRFMEAVAHGMKPRKGGPSEAVAKEFVKADSVVSKRRANDKHGYKADKVAGTPGRRMD